MEVLLRHNNQRHKLRVDADATLESLMRHVDALTNIAPSRQLLKVGYPPQPLGGLRRNGADGIGRRRGVSLRELGIQSNELIIVEEAPAGPPEEEEWGEGERPAAAGETPAAPEETRRPAPSRDGADSSLSLERGEEEEEEEGEEEEEVAAAGRLAKNAAAAAPSTANSRSPSELRQTSSRPAAAAAEEEEEDAYTWEEDVAFEEEEEDGEDEEEEEEEEAVGMPVGCGGAAEEAHRAAAEGRGGSAVAQERADRAAVRETIRRESEYFGAGGYLRDEEEEEEDYLRGGAKRAAGREPTSAAPWSSPGGGGARLLRVGGRGPQRHHSNGGSCSKKRIVQEAADPSIVGEAMRYVVPSDNSCLFTCLCLLAAPHATPQQLRALVGSAIDADPENFTDAVLDRPRQEYIEWILSPTSWGGYVELAILAQQLQHEVVCVDVETRRKDFYGDARTGRRVYLLYDGVHYDAIVARRKPVGGAVSAAERAAAGCRPRGLARPPATAGAGGGAGDGLATDEEYLRVFSPNDREMEAKAAAVAAELHQRKQFTNLQLMKMQCLVCGAGIRDQEHAREHAREFGHANFGETRR